MPFLTNCKLFVLLLLAGFFLVMVLGCDSGYFSRTSSKPTLVKQYNEHKVKEDAALYLKGKTLFENLCNSCHVSSGSQVEGDFLFQGIFEILPSPEEEYFIAYIANSKSLKEANDSYAIEIAKKYNTGYEHLFIDSLTINNYSELIAYIKMATLEKRVSK